MAFGPNETADQASLRRPQRDDILKIPRRSTWRTKFLLEREVAGSKLIAPDWNHCSGYELQLRKEALWLVREAKYSIEKALWTAYNNQHHRIEHWLTLLTIANAGGASTSTKTSSSSTTSNSSDQRLQRIDKKFAKFERAMQRSSPKPFRHPKVNWHFQRHPLEVEDVEGERTERVEVKATRPHLKRNLHKTRRAFAMSSKRDSVPQTLVRGTIVVLNVERPTCLTSHAIALTILCQCRPEQTSFFIILRKILFLQRVLFGRSSRATRLCEVYPTPLPCPHGHGRPVSRD